MATNRNSLMDYIDETYNTMESGDLLEQTMLDMFGDKLLNADGVWSDEGPDGMYTNLSNPDLVALANRLDDLTEGTDKYDVTIKLTGAQINSLASILSDFIDRQGRIDTTKAKHAKLILQQIR